MKICFIKRNQVYKYINIHFIKIKQNLFKSIHNQMVNTMVPTFIQHSTNIYKYIIYHSTYQCEAFIIQIQILYKELRYD